MKAAALFVLLLLVATAARGVIISVDLGDTPKFVGATLLFGDPWATGGDHFVDLNADGAEDLRFVFGLGQITVESVGSTRVRAVSIPPDLNGFNQYLSAGHVIGETEPWFDGLVGLNADFDGPGQVGPFQRRDGYLGFRLELDDGYHYAWLHYSGWSDHGFIHGWAYEATPDTAIIAGAIPEPGALALLTMGGLAAAGWAARRRRR